MIGKIIGALAGAQASKYTSSLGGRSGALLGALAIPVLGRMKWTSLAAIAAGGYLIAKLNDKANSPDRP